MLNDQFKYFMEWCVKSMIPLRVSSVNTCPGCKTQINFWPCRTLLRRSKRKLLSPSLTLNPLLLKLPGLLPKMLMTRFLRHKLIPWSRRICWIVRCFFFGFLKIPHCIWPNSEGCYMAFRRETTCWWLESMFCRYEKHLMLHLSNVY